MNTSQREPSEARARRVGFTLIELLAVLVIAGLLMAFAIPAVTGIGKGTSMQASISNLRSTISLARQWAITKRKTVYIVLPDQSAANFSTEAEAAMACRGYAVFEVSNPATGDGQYITEWKSLPAGIVFDTAPPNPPLDRVATVFQPAYRKLVAFPTATSPKKTLHTLTITPSGTVGGGIDTGRLYLREGQSYPTGTAPNYQIFGNTTWRLEVNPFTGVLRADDITP